MQSGKIKMEKIWPYEFVHTLPYTTYQYIAVRRTPYRVLVPRVSRVTCVSSTLEQLILSETQWGLPKNRPEINQLVVNVQ